MPRLFVAFFSLFKPVVLNLFAEGSQNQTYGFLKEPHWTNFYYKSIGTFCFIAERSLFHKI